MASDFAMHELGSVVAGLHRKLDGHADIVDVILRLLLSQPKIASCSEDGTIKIWASRPTGAVECEFTLDGHTNWVTCLAFNPSDPHRLITGSRDKTVTSWDIAAGTCVSTFNVESEVWSVACSPSGRKFAAACNAHKDYKIKIASLQTGEVQCVLHGHTSWVNCVSFHPIQDNRLVTSSRDKTLKFWDVEMGTCVSTVQGDFNMTCVAFSPSGKLIAAGDGGGNIRLMSEHGDEKDVLNGDKPVSCVAFSPDGMKVAAGDGRVPMGSDFKVRVYDIRTGKGDVCFFKGGDTQINSVAFSPDGQSVAAGDGGLRQRGRIRRYCAATGKLLSVLTGHRCTSSP